VSVFGRDLLICDCDDFTKLFMEENFGMQYEGRTISLEEDRPDQPRMEIPPYTGFGSEEDSLGSFYSLVPKAPRQNWAHYFENDKKILRFISQLDTNAPEDRERLFIVSYYLADDTISVYEPPARNSGFMGGKFMERCQAKDPETNELYVAKDFKVGGMMTFRCHRFVLIEADEYTLNYMENKKFPASDVTAIVAKLKEKFIEQAALIRDVFRRVDEDHSGTLSMSEFKQALKKFNFDVTDQELISIMRKFDPDGDGSIRYDEFCASVLADDYKQVEASSGGQVLHGESRYKEESVVKAEEAAKKQVEEDKHQRLESLLADMRGAINGADCSDLFMAADERGNGHCDYDAFANLLQQMGFNLNEEDMQLMMESFFDPEHEDQTRPMSIAVLDVALFR